MLKENIKTIRKAKGLSQEELAIKLNVVRQTISKWEQGLSVPDSEMLLDLIFILFCSFYTALSVLIFNFIFSRISTKGNFPPTVLR